MARFITLENSETRFLSFFDCIQKPFWIFKLIFGKYQHWNIISCKNCLYWVNRMVTVSRQSQIENTDLGYWMRRQICSWESECSRISSQDWSRLDKTSLLEILQIGENDVESDTAKHIHSSNTAHTSILTLYRIMHSYSTVDFFFSRTYCLDQRPI